MQKRKQLNLFAFTPETDALFGMLIIVSIALTLFLGHAFALLFGFGDPLSKIEPTARGLQTTQAYISIIFFQS